MDESIANAGSWDELKPALSPTMMAALAQLGYTQMTAVQAHAAGPFMRHKDVVVEAVTGSGKTLAFVVPVLEMLLRRTRGGDGNEARPLRKTDVAALIISPTRELAKQIHCVLAAFIDAIDAIDAANNLNGNDRDHNNDNDNSDDDDDDDDHRHSPAPRLTHKLFIGGNDVQDDIRAFQATGANIIIGTPGRLDDLLKRQTLFNLKELEVLVMDEADRLLDMGFEQSLTSIIRKLPKQRRTGLFSATMNEAIHQLIRTGLRNPVKIVVKVENLDSNGVASEGVGAASESDQRTPSTLEIGYAIVQPDNRIPLLLHILRENADKKFIVYFSTCACVDYYSKALPMLSDCEGLQFYALHGKMDPKRREAVYTKFIQAPFASVLLCTDVAARGLDIPDVDWVVQLDPPQDPKAFAHRCGRTARFGRQGKAIVFLTPQEDTYVEFLRLRKIPMNMMTFEGFTCDLNPDADMDDTDPATTATTATLPAAKTQSNPTVNPYIIKPTQHGDVLDRLKQASLSDRDVYEKSIKAFVSWTRAYSKHEASYIFRLKELDLAGVAKSFGILRMPRMPELKNVQSGFVDTVFDANAIKYADKTREKQRQERLKKDAIALVQGTLKPKKVFVKRTEAWSKSKETKEKRIERKQKREKRRIATLKSQTAAAESSLNTGVSATTTTTTKTKPATATTVNVKSDHSHDRNDASVVDVGDHQGRGNAVGDGAKRGKDDADDLDFLDDYKIMKKDKRQKRSASTSATARDLS